METGDLYTKHVRGSRYAFNHDGFLYKYPNNQKSYCKNFPESVLDDLIRVKGGSGRAIINEIGEIVVYKKREKENVWEPRYVDTLDRELEFEYIKINPKNLKPGLMWTGFCSHHGGAFSIDSNGRPFFSEKIKNKYSENKKRYYIKDFNKKILKRIIHIKMTGSGRFRVNEYGHIWAPVKNENLKFQIQNEDFKEAFTNQFGKFPSKLKRIIKAYQEYDHTPIYMGKIEGELEIVREEKPHIIRGKRNFNELDFGNSDLEYYD